MCGIAGYSLSRGFHPRLDSMQSTCDLLAHRGPDDHGVFEDPDRGIGLAHTRLSILDLSSFGHQPMISVNGCVV